MPQFRKKPIEVEAFRFTGEFDEDVMNMIHLALARYLGESASGRPAVLEIATLEGTMTAMPGDWIVRGTKGEFYPVKPDIFEATYEPV